VTRRVGRRGAALLFFALLDLVYAHSLLWPPHAARTSDTLQFVASLAPLWGWAILWSGGGLACLVWAFRRQDQPGFAAAIAVYVLWGLTMLGGQATGRVERGYVSAVIWLTLAAFVGLLATWPEPGGKGSRWTPPTS
jgi:hypothetical protein